MGIYEDEKSLGSLEINTFGCYGMLVRCLSQYKIYSMPILFYINLEKRYFWKDLNEMLKFI
jgi:hypothetical protein